MVLVDEYPDSEGVLLYYKYVDIPDTCGVRDWLESLCQRLSLVGRVRVSPQGVNVTVGGSMKSLQEHIDAVSTHPSLGTCDFKLDRCIQPSDPQIAAQCGFTSLLVRIVKEVVSLSPLHGEPDLSHCGPHITPHELHHLLSSPPPTPHPTPSLLLLDARNIYESRIGRFQGSEGNEVEVFTPPIRQFSDLPAWMDANASRLQHRRVVMYCTGGVRCESASAYLRAKGEGFQEVSQLSGGIERYLQAFPSGGFFRGQNFVFDPRLAVGSEDPTLIGLCLLCGASCNDYATRCRCATCRMLVLVCASCQEEDMYTCELCAATWQPPTSATWPSDIIKAPAQALSTPPTGSVPGGAPRKLRILCLHGFRQSASSLKGRTAALQKKLRQLAELVFVDGAHVVPFVGRMQGVGRGGGGGGEVLCGVDPGAGREGEAVAEGGLDKVRVSRAAVEETSGQEAMRVIVESDVAQGGTGGGLQGEAGERECDVDRSACVKPRYAWLIDPSGDVAGAGAMWRDGSRGAEPESCRQTPRPLLFSPDQYKSQRGGWGESLEYLEAVCRDQGPFDGVLGFSQGAAVAAAWAAWQDKERGGRGCSSGGVGSTHFKFVILCSGFLPPSNVWESVVRSSSAQIMCPSLHIYGGSPGEDRQICLGESEALADVFEAGGRVVVRHEQGHIIPTRVEYANVYRTFLDKFAL